MAYSDGKFPAPVSSRAEERAGMGVKDFGLYWNAGPRDLLPPWACHISGWDFSTPLRCARDDDAGGQLTVIYRKGSHWKGAVKKWFPFFHSPFLGGIFHDRCLLPLWTVCDIMSEPYQQEFQWAPSIHGMMGLNGIPWTLLSRMGQGGYYG